MKIMINLAFNFNEKIINCVTFELVEGDRISVIFYLFLFYYSFFLFLKYLLYKNAFKIKKIK